MPVKRITLSIVTQWYSSSSSGSLRCLCLSMCANLMAIMMLLNSIVIPVKQLFAKFWVCLRKAHRSTRITQNSGVNCTYDDSHCNKGNSKSDHKANQVGQHRHAVRNISAGIRAPAIDAIHQQIRHKQSEAACTPANYKAC